MSSLAKPTACGLKRVSCLTWEQFQKRGYHNIYIVIGRLPVYLGRVLLISPWTSRQEIKVINLDRWFDGSDTYQHDGRRLRFFKNLASCLAAVFRDGTRSIKVAAATLRLPNHHRNHPRYSTNQ